MCLVNEDDVGQGQRHCIAIESTGPQRIDRGDLHCRLRSQSSRRASHDDPMAHPIAVELAGNLLDDLSAMREK
jgi:hypothetical protein